MEAEIVLDATLKKLKSRFNYPPPPWRVFMYSCLIILMKRNVLPLVWKEVLIKVPHFLALYSMQGFHSIVCYVGTGNLFVEEISVYIFSLLKVPLVIKNYSF